MQAFEWFEALSGEDDESGTIGSGGGANGDDKFVDGIVVEYSANHVTTFVRAIGHPNGNRNLVSSDSSFPMNCS